MIKVGLYLENKNIKSVDLSKPEEGNPGIGGTQYNFLTMPYYFQKYHPDEIKFIYYANFINNLPTQFKSVYSKDCLEALEKCENDQCDILIWRPTNDESSRKMLNQLDNYKVKVVAWIHNTPNISLLNEMSKKKQLRRYVAVSEERLDMVRDHDIIYKGTVIYNGFDPDKYTPKTTIQKDPNMVVYVGSLIPTKGFGMLAKVWKEILSRKPGTKLYVIGSGKVYNRSSKMGKWGVADEKFEAGEIRPYLSDNDDNIHKSVNFLGILGNEQIKYLQKATVGVVNPTGKSEYCPGSAMEFQAAGTPVVAAAKWGFLDTVINNKTGLLGKNEKDLVNNILYFLESPHKSEKFGKRGIKFIDEKFNYKKISEQWLELFGEVYNNKKPELKPINQNLFHRYKYLREIMRILKRYFPLFKIIPPIFRIEGYFKRIKNKL